MFWYCRICQNPSMFLQGDCAQTELQGIAFCLPSCEYILFSWCKSNILQVNKNTVTVVFFRLILLQIFD